MNRHIPLELVVAVTTVAVTVDSAAGGAGAAVANTTPSRSVKLRNTSGRSFEYKVDSGDWTLLKKFQDVTLDVNLATQTITLRKSSETGNSDPTAALDIEASAGTMQLDGESVGGDTRRVAADVTLLATDDVVSFTNTTGPAAKRNVIFPAAAVDGRSFVLLPDGGDQAFTVEAADEAVIVASTATGTPVTELAHNRAWTVVWMAELDKWVAY